MRITELTGDPHKAYNDAKKRQLKDRARKLNIEKKQHAAERARQRSIKANAELTKARNTK
jgi:hypothetical protein